MPVLLQESLECLNIKESGTYVDATFGAGGHTREILKKLTSGKLYGFDQDDSCNKYVPENSNFKLINANFKYLQASLMAEGVKEVDGILADLGVSSMQFDETERGFSYRGNADLDMRMNTNQNFSAFDVINAYSLEELVAMFKKYAELKKAYYLAKTIVEHRQAKPIESIEEFLVVIEPEAPKQKKMQWLSQVFQAIRIEVNDEIEVLKEFLSSTLEVMDSGARLVVISYHSLEDRLVKNFFRSGNFEGKLEKDFYGNVISPWREISKKPIIPNEQEIESNSRSRSAKLRWAEKK